MSATAINFVAYLRAQDSENGHFGPELDAQAEIIWQFAKTRSAKVIAREFVEVESRNQTQRPQLEKALDYCRDTGATLIVGNMDRLFRNATFLMTLRDSGVPFIAADMPDVNSTTMGVLAQVAQREHEAVAARIKAGLRAAKARGRNLGGRRPGTPNIVEYQGRATEAIKAKADLAALKHRGIIDAFMGERLSMNQIAFRLNGLKIKTIRGGTWTATSVKRTVNRYRKSNSHRAGERNGK